MMIPTTSTTPALVKAVRRIRRGQSDGGFTLAELLVSMVLTGILGTICTYAFISANVTFRQTDDEATGLADTKTVIERLGRDIRAARGVDSGATASTLSLWIDYNSDYIRNATSQKNEIITWSLVSQGAGSTQYNTLRSTAGGTAVVQARTLVSNIAFCYQSDPDAACFTTPLSVADAEATTLITATLTYDSLVSSGSGQRTVSFTERIRNVS
jgi:prepilin-type N-terminal cleavage/methylation domain-containing protein